MDAMIEDMFARLMAEHCTPAMVRKVEEGNGEGASATLDALRSEIVQTGLHDALVPEDLGGIGLTLADLVPVFRLIGAHAAPLALAETMIARAILARAGVDAPDGTIVLASATEGSDGRIETPVVPLARTASHILVDCGERMGLFATGAEAVIASGGRYSLSARLRFDRAAASAWLDPTATLRPIAALLHAAKMSGAMRKLLEMSVDYANLREQFGRPIGRFQAIQHQLSVMAEEVAAATMAVEVACDGARDGLWPDVLKAAMAKERTSAVAPSVSAAAHAVHGAIGISAEHDLHLLTRRLREWRVAEGAESYWSREIGIALLSSEKPAVDFIRLALAS